MKSRLAQGLVAALLAGASSCGGGCQHDVATPRTSAEQQAAEWAAATAEAEKIVSDMTRDERVRLVRGQSRPSADKHLSAGHVPAITVGKTGFVIPAQYLCDGPSGVGNFNQGVTRFPTAISVAASFDVELARAFGEALGEEWAGKGCTHGLGPGLNIIRLPQGGRSAEYYSEDPYLAASIAVAEVQGIQAQHVIATLKHFAANSQETEREGGNSALAERTLREIYLPAFEAAAREGGAGALMCSYNRVNGTYACEHAHLQNDIARGDWGFRGLIMSDWGANHGNTPEAAARYAQSGLDLDMPGAPQRMAAYTPENLARVGDDQLRVMCTRILAAMFKVGLLRGDGPTRAGDGTDVTGGVSTQAHKQLAQEIAAAGTVLLKNAGGLLPLDRSDARLKIAVIGGAGGTDRQTSLGGSGNVQASEDPVSPLAGIEALGIAGSVTYSKGAPGGAGSLGDLPVHSTVGATTPDGWAVTFVTGAGEPLYNDARRGAFPVTRIGALPNQTCEGGAPSCVGGAAYLADGRRVSLVDGSVPWRAVYSGYFTVSAAGTYEFTLFSAGATRLLIDGAPIAKVDSTLLVESDDAHVALTVGEHAVEVALDTTALQWLAAPGVSLQFDGGADAMGAAVAAAAAADVAIVVVSDVESEGLDHSVYLPAAQNELVVRVAAAAKRTVVVLNTGSGLVLPWADKVDAIVEAWYGGQRLGLATASVLFGEVNPSGRAVVTFPASAAQWYAQEASQYPGVKVGADAFHTVRYDEGVFAGYRWFDRQGLAPLFPFGHGLSYTTFKYSDLALSSTRGRGETTATVRITNTGTRPGAEVAQLYLGFPEQAGEPPLQLKGFQKVKLAPGASADVSFPLDHRAFEYWDEATRDWAMPAGDFTLHVGSSSRDIRAVAGYTVTERGSP